MRYNKSEIMKKAWNIFKSTKYSFSESLKRAWAQAKDNDQNSLTSETFKNGMEITVDGYTRTLSRWSKGDRDRVYINGGSRKGDGYVDLKSGKSFLNGNLTYQIKIAEMILAMAF